MNTNDAILAMEKLNADRRQRRIACIAKAISNATLNYYDLSSDCERCIELAGRCLDELEKIQ